MKENKPNATPVPEDQELFDEIMSKVKRMREEISSPPKEPPKPPQEPGQEKPAAPAPGPEIPSPIVPEMPVQPPQPQPGGVRLEEQPAPDQEKESPPAAEPSTEPPAPPAEPISAKAEPSEPPQEPEQPVPPQQPAAAPAAKASLPEQEPHPSKPPAMPAEDKPFVMPKAKPRPQNLSSIFPEEKPKKKQKKRSFFKRNKPEEDLEETFSPEDFENDIYYGLKLKPMDEYRRERDAQGRKFDTSEPTSSFPHLFEKQEDAPDLTPLLEELHKKRQEQVTQAAQEAGVETDDIYAIYDEGDEDGLHFDYDEWKRSTQQIPIITEEDLHPAAAAPSAEPASVPEAATPAPDNTQPLSEDDFVAAVAQAAANPEAAWQETAPPSKEEPPAVPEEPKNPTVSSDTLKFKLLKHTLGEHTTDIKLPVEHISDGHEEADSIEAKEVEVDRLIAQAISSLDPTRKSIFDQVASERLGTNLTAEDRAEPSASAVRETLLENAPVTKYRFRQRPMRIYKLTNMEPIVAAETRLFSAGAPAQEPKEPESRDIFSISEDEAVVKNAVSKVISENKEADSIGAGEATPSPAISSITGQGRKVISIPLKKLHSLRPDGGKTEDAAAEEEEEARSPHAPSSFREKLKNRPRPFQLQGEEEDNDPEDEFQPEQPELEDYNRTEDARAIRSELASSSRELTIRTIATGLCAAVLGVMGLFFEFFIPQSSKMAYLILNLIFLLIATGFCYRTMLSGIKSLFRLRANADSSIAIATIASIIHGGAMFVTSGMNGLIQGALHIYSPIVIGALFLNSMGKLLIISRIRKNFRFITSSDLKYNVQIYGDHEVALQLVKGCLSEKPVIAYQQKTHLLKNFLTNSYENDPSENTSQFIAPISFIASLALCVVCTIISSGDVVAGLTAFAIATCISTPIANMVCANFPISSLCRIARQNNAMIVGYKGLSTMCDTNAVMLDSTDLYPDGTVVLAGMETLGQKRIDQALLYGAALTCATGGTLRYVFENVIQNQRGMLPRVENNSYVDNAGIVGWVRGQRVLIGNRELLKQYSVVQPEEALEQGLKKNQRAVFLAVDTRPVAMITLEYHPDKKLAENLQNLETNGVSLLVRTLDPNLTADFLAQQYDLDARAIRVLPEELGEVCDKSLNSTVDEADVLLATKGKAFSMIRMLSACIHQKSNISIAVILQTVSVCLGFILVTIFCCWSGLHRLTSLSIVIYEVFWLLAILLIPKIRKP